MGGRDHWCAAFLIVALVACGVDGDPAGVGDATGDALLEIGDPALEPFVGDLPQMRKRRVVRALVAPSRTDFFLDDGRIRGLQADLLRELEKQLNRGRTRPSERIRVLYVPVAFGELIPALESGRGDLVAAFLTETPARRERVRFVGGLRQRIDEVVVTHESVPPPEDLDDLAGRELYVLRGSSYVDHLHDLNGWLVENGLRPMRIREADPRLESEDILELVNAGVVKATVVDAYKARLWARVLPEVVVHEHVAVAEGRRAGWAVRRDSHELARELDDFAKRTGHGTRLGNLLFRRYLQDLRFIRAPGREERDRLERYLPIFEKYGERYGWDPMVLAAQAYQESRLDPRARSRSGAIGLMQLLESTARDENVGISRLQEPEQNVHAGAKYMAFLRDRYFSSPEISEWDRTALSLAAYNAGPRRAQTARREARRLGLDPDVWFDNVEVATGRRVGGEPVRYVSNVYKYWVAFKLVRQRESERARAEES